jgi:hypothetical protein
MVQLYIRDNLVVTSDSLIAMQRRFFFPDLFVGAFAKFRKATHSFIMSLAACVCLSALNNWAPTEHIFMKFDI